MRLDRRRTNRKTKEDRIGVNRMNKERCGTKRENQKERKKKQK